MLPVIRIFQGRYLIGTESKTLQIKGEVCMVRVGGGFERLEVYLRRNQESELEKIRRLMVEQRKKYKTVILEFLKRYGAETRVIESYNQM